jgi:hypothetical protein
MSPHRLDSLEQRGKAVTPGNIAYYTLLQLKLGRKSHSADAMRQGLCHDLQPGSAFSFLTATSDTAVNLNRIQHMKDDENVLPGLDVLNTGYGDFELRFDPNKPDDVQKAKETITDMLKRGYAIFVCQGNETLRVRKFDANRNVYIIGSTPAEEVPITETRAIAVGRSAGG